MKKFALFLACVIFTINNGCGQSQNYFTQIEAENMLMNFYTNYIKVFATEPPGSTSQKKLEMLQKHYCTETFFNKIQELIEETGSDPFLKAQDSDIAYLATLTVSKHLLKNQYLVSYVADAAPEEKVTVTILVTVVKEGENCKISDLK